MCIRDRDLGSEEPILDDKGNLIAQTICHHGSKFKLYYYPDSRMFHCYTDCGDSFDIYELVIRSKRSVGITISFPQAVRYVANISNLLLFENDELEQFKEQKIDDWGWLSKFTQKEKKFRKDVYKRQILNIVKLEDQNEMESIILQMDHKNTVWKNSYAKKGDSYGE